MQPADAAVDAVQPGRHAGQVPAGIEGALRHLDGELRGLSEGLDAALLAALLGDLVERHLGSLDLALGIDRLAGVERQLDHLAAYSDQLAQQGEVVDLAGEVARADERRAAPGEVAEIGGAAELLHAFVGVEHRPERDRIRDHVAVHQPQDRLVDAGVDGLVEVIGAQPRLDVLDQPVVDHQGAEKSGLRLDVAGQGRGLRAAGGGNESDRFCHGVVVGAERTGLNPPARLIHRHSGECG